MADQGIAPINLPDASSLPAPEAVNFFTFSWNSGTEVQLLAGYIDLLELTREAATKAGVAPAISHRLFMSMRGFALLRAQVLEASDMLIRSGVPLDELNPLAKAPEKKK